LFHIVWLAGIKSVLSSTAHFFLLLLLFCSFYWWKMNQHACAVPEENAHSIDLPSSSTNSHTVRKKISHSQHSEVEVIVLVRSSSTILTQRNSSAVYGWLVEIKLTGFRL
jgi:hypothetical protein